MFLKLLIGFINQLMKPVLPPSNLNLLVCTTCKVIDLDESFRTGSWNSLDRISSTSKNAYVILTKSSIQIHEAVPQSNPNNALVKIIELNELQQIDLPFRSYNDMRSGNEIAIRSSEMVLSARQHIVWLVLEDNQTRGLLLEEITLLNMQCVVEQRALAETVADIVNFRTEAERSPRRPPGGSASPVRRSAPLRLQWIESQPMDGKDKMKELMNQNAYFFDDSNESELMCVISKAEMTHINGMYREMGKMNVDGVDLVPWFWNEQSNTFIKHEIAQDGSKGWIVGRSIDGVHVAVQSLSTNAPPEDGWTRVLQGGYVRSKMKLKMVC